MSSSSSDPVAIGAAILRAVLALLPVQLFLLGLLLGDSFRLVRPRRVLGALTAGAVVAGLAFVVNNTVYLLAGLSPLAFAVLAAPLVEEALKGAWLDWLVRTRRVGFLVDAAILGFATGAGFATVENLHYLRSLPDAPWLVWVIRGLGTAVMHGGAAAIFAVLRQAWSVAERPAWAAWLTALPAAVIFHAGFNRLMTHPVPATVALLVTLPLVLRLVHRVGERRLRRWLGDGFDRDRELLEVIRSGTVRTTPLGQYLDSLRNHFRPEVVADMLCLLRLEAELSIRAKGLLMLREHGFPLSPPPEIADQLAEWHWLRRSVGRTGMWALAAVRPWRGRNAWQRRLLTRELARSGRNRDG
jgi:RsiW-degrading membrane proteinase PrsW (M82 family)